MSSPAVILRQILLNAELVYQPAGKDIIPIAQLPNDGAYPCFVHSIPDTPDALVSILNSEGTYFCREMEGPTHTHPGLRIFVRALDNSGYDNLVIPIITLLDAVAPSALAVGQSTYYIQSIYRSGAVITLGEEVPKKRQRWMIHARIAFQNRQGPMG